MSDTVTAEKSNFGVGTFSPVKIDGVVLRKDVGGIKRRLVLNYHTDSGSFYMDYTNLSDSEAIGKFKEEIEKRFSCKIGGMMVYVEEEALL